MRSKPKPVLPDSAVANHPLQSVDVDRAFGLFCRLRNITSVAKIMGCSIQSVSNALNKYQAFQQALLDLPDIRQVRGDMYAAGEIVLFRSLVEDKKLEQSPLSSRAVAFGIVNERRRLEEGKATQNHALHGTITAIQRQALEVTLQIGSPVGDGKSVQKRRRNEQTQLADLNEIIREKKIEFGSEECRSRAVAGAKSARNDRLHAKAATLMPEEPVAGGDDPIPTNLVGDEAAATESGS